MKKIPDHATKVFEGIVFDVYHWEQELFDGKKTTFEAIKRVDSNTIIATTEDGHVLITKEEQPNKKSFTGLPGGRIEKGELPKESAKRELVEETGYASDEIIEWFVEDSSKTSKIEWNTFYYIAKNAKKLSEQSLDSGEKIEVEKVSFDDFVKRRKEFCSHSSDLLPILEKAANDETEKQKLKDLLGITS